MFHVMAQPPVPPRGAAPPQAPARAPAPPMPQQPQGGAPQAAQRPAAPQPQTTGIGEILRDRAKSLTPQDQQTFEVGITVPALLVLKKMIPEIGPAIDGLIAKKQGGTAAPAQAAGAPAAAPAQPVAQPGAPPAPAPAPAPQFAPRQPVTQLGRVG